MGVIYMSRKSMLNNDNMAKTSVLQFIVQLLIYTQ